MTKLEEYYSKQPEPVQGSLLALKHIIMSVDKEITHMRIFQISFFLYKDWRLAFLQVYGKKIMFSIVNDRCLQPATKGHKRRDGMGATFMLDSNKDLPIDDILRSLREQIVCYDKVGVKVE